MSGVNFELPMLQYPRNPPSNIELNSWFAKGFIWSINCERGLVPKILNALLKVYYLLD
jgi:hypothetical protein